MRNRTTFDIVGPDGRRATVTPRSDADTVGDLALALGHEGPKSISVDGQPAVAARRLVDVPALRSGAHVEVGHRPVPRPPATERPVVGFEVIAGPSCRSWTPLGPGRHTIGRSNHCTIRLGDALAELHHGVLDVSPSGSVCFTQLTGRVPSRLDGEPCRPGQPIGPGATLEIGASLLIVRPVPNDTASSAAEGGSIVAGPDPWRQVVRRGPADDADWTWPTLSAPDPPAAHASPPATALIGAIVAVAGALVVASVMGQVMFALFALFGAVASFATWLVGVGAAARRRRRERRNHRARVERFGEEVGSAITAWRAHHVGRHRTIIETLDEISRPRGRLWERRPDEGGEVRLSVGVCTLSARPPVDGWSTLASDITADVDRLAAADLQPAPVVLRPGDGLAVHGDVAPVDATIRSLILQLATWIGPADWQLLVVSRHPGRWEWASWLPHAVRPDGSRGVVTPDRVDAANERLVGDRITVVVTDEVALFDARTGPTRRLIAARRSIVFAAVSREQSVPSVCGLVLRLGSTGRADWATGAPPGTHPSGLRIAGVDAQTAATAARRLAPLIDPEDATASTSALPSVLSFADLDEHRTTEPEGDRDDDPVSRIVDRWRAGGADPAPCGPIGMSADGTIDIDLVRDGPHGLIAGTTGSGKSELLRTLVLALATRCSPEHLTFVLVDYKGGSTFDACARLPHVVGLITDLDEGAAERALVSLEAELRRRERLLRDVGAADLTDYRSRPGIPPLPRLAVVVDEFAALVQELPDFLASLVGIAQRGRSLGVHLLLATQRPAGVVSDDIRANTNLRLALRLHDTADARDVVGDELPATLSRGQAGRAVLRLGPNELVVFQTACCTAPVVRSASRLSVTIADTGAGPSLRGAPDVPTELSTTVDAVCAAAERLALPPPHPPWVDPLPMVLDPAEVDRVSAGESDAADGAVGLIDDPEHQARRTLRWDPAVGNLALVGPLGSGVTSTLVGLAAALCRATPPDSLHLYVVDAVGDPSLDGIGSIAHCGAVVRVREVERLHRLLARLAAELDRRVDGVGEFERVIVLIDGVESLRASLSSIERAETLALFERVTSDGAALGISCVVAGTDVSRIECAQRWVFGRPGAATPASSPGRITIETSGLEGQIVFGAPGLAALPDRSAGDGPARVEMLAERIGRRELAASWSSGEEATASDHLVVGRSAERLDDVALTVPVGDHVFVGGPSRSGKSNVLKVLTAAWRDLHRDGIVVEVGRRRALDPEALDDRATLVVVDDADRVDDPVVAALAADHRAGVTLLIAARMEAVRARYGHWTRDVARSRCGVVLTSTGEIDGELLGATLPSRAMIPARPGLAWIIDRDGQRLAQVAVPEA